MASRSKIASSRSPVKLGLGVGIFVLTLVTALIHLYLGLGIGNTLFVLNGLGLPGASGSAAAADPATGALPKYWAMGSSSLHSADDRALLHHRSVLLGHRLRRQSDRGSPDRATHHRDILPGLL